MAATVRPGSVPHSEDHVILRLRADGLRPHGWGNGPHQLYGWHQHDYRKILYCVDGSIVFHTADGDLPLVPGDRLDLDPHTPHAATVGPGGVRCVEAAS